ncbi:MAG: hypothetical protein EBT86_07340 [Actinobacteria bacterium]|nr:hypothetical protein [Actinomycetota bacterium]NCY08414.1 hypothetical protein [Betaproteobacteria bacterium]
MLIKKSFTTNDVVSLKISSGEEVIARFIGEDKEYFHVTKPNVLMMNQQGMGMVPFMITSNPDQDYAIAKQNIIAISFTDNDVGKLYLSKTSGIAL